VKNYGRPLRLLLEPGRCLLADAGALLVTVLAVRNRSAARTIIVDGGMHTLARPAIYGAHHELLPVRHTPATTPADVAGPICESTDYLARNRNLPALQRGDRLAICTTGAYGYSMASQYNAQPRPAEVLLAGASARIIRRRETFADLDGADG
jgi:diaminopimelate decarboxylase